ncbi:MAG: S1 RNA-binding domain-containing protein [Spirochaetaceae bacterium]|nr:S1 RNA-binding domain-containing protein [Spirochaetaceae bacterium]
MYEQSFSGFGFFKPGQAIETEVVSISKDSVFLQVSGKSEGIIAREELTDEKGNLSVKVGDRIRAFFLKAEGGEMRFTTRISGKEAGARMLVQAFREKSPVEGLVEKEIKGGYDVKIGEFRAFCPYSMMGDRRSEDPAEYVGKRLPFRIQEFGDKGRSILVSNRAIHEEARQKRLEELKKSLSEGAVVKGRVASIQSYGAFVDLGGLQALLPVSEISRSRVEDIHAVLEVGQEIEAEILKLDWQGERISLSMKSLVADPWDSAAERYPLGSKHAGKVVRLADFGAFVSLEPGVDGLVHDSELAKASGEGPRGALSLKLGQELSVEILGVDQDRRRISLKPASSAEEDETTARYMGDSGDSDTYNPFAALLKK